MPQYSVADAKNGLPGLIDKALAGEEVVITRHGKPVVELRPALPTSSTTQAEHAALDEWLQTRRDQRKSVGITSVELLNAMYEDE